MLETLPVGESGDEFQRRAGVLCYDMAVSAEYFVNINATIAGTHLMIMSAWQ